MIAKVTHRDPVNSCLHDRPLFRLQAFKPILVFVGPDDPKPNIAFSVRHAVHNVKLSFRGLSMRAVHYSFFLLSYRLTTFSMTASSVGIKRSTSVAPASSTPASRM